MEDRRALLPSTTEALAHPTLETAVDQYGRQRVLAALRQALGDERTRPSTAAVPTVDEVADATVAVIELTAPLEAVVNATGVVVHTNLGRAVLSSAAIEALAVAAGTVDVEYDRASGGRSRRGRHVATLLATMCEAERAHVVNNGAAALVLAVAVLCAEGGREVVVSRGELVEIGGSFRLPDILTSAGARLREVGTTNRTRLDDYADAIGDRTGAVLRVHPSNYRIEGFTERPSLDDLGALARARGVPLVHDLGSGLLRPSDVPQLAGEPDAVGSIAGGADLVLFSGDKLLGGPQVGVIAGDAELVERCRRHPLARALRPDKLRLAALEATLADHARQRRSSLPTWRLIETAPVALRARAEHLAAEVGGRVVATDALVGGGAAPTEVLASWGIELPGDPEALARALRHGSPPVVPRTVDGRVVLDLRSVPQDEDDTLLDAVRTAMP